jgi:catechol 2,3-dioxygenase-like lactoylglutathione lyase family enzyme
VSGVDVHGLVWMGVRTPRLAETSAFLERLGLRRERSESEMAVFQAGNGDTVEVFGPGDEDHRHFDTGPVVGFLVDDVEQARRELEVEGIEFIGPVERGGGMAWTHLRGPDGNVYELTQRQGD